PPAGNLCRTSRSGDEISAINFHGSSPQYNQVTFGVRVPDRTGSSQPIRPLDLVLLQAAYPRQGATAVRYGDAHNDLVGARRIGHAHFDGVEVRAHVGRILVTERHVDRSAGTAAFLG